MWIQRPGSLLPRRAADMVINIAIQMALGSIQIHQYGNPSLPKTRRVVPTLAGSLLLAALAYTMINLFPAVMCMAGRQASGHRGQSP